MFHPNLYTYGLCDRGSNGKLCTYGPSDRDNRVSYGKLSTYGLSDTGSSNAPTDYVTGKLCIYGLCDRGSYVPMYYATGEEMFLIVYLWAKGSYVSLDYVTLCTYLCTYVLSDRDKGRDRDGYGQLGSYVSMDYLCINGLCDSVSYVSMDYVTAAAIYVSMDYMTAAAMYQWTNYISMDKRLCDRDGCEQQCIYGLCDRSIMYVFTYGLCDRDSCEQQCIYGLCDRSIMYVFTYGLCDRDRAVMDSCVHMDLLDYVRGALCIYRLSDRDSLGQLHTYGLIIYPYIYLLTICHDIYLWTKGSNGQLHTYRLCDRDRLVVGLGLGLGLG
ncbi:hypothetical protein DPMN_075210 [Dreissena polymorpha]|uniref:Uncharacterized protein n=1 Tax=Dreissena polymorpha TaxID=45954 RepID=A0A9D3YJZ5_DREPO|nr:hypothetical protein DPMN_075210 [Dreissena polymorpha]